MEFSLKDGSGRPFDVVFVPVSLRGVRSTVTSTAAAGFGHHRDAGCTRAGGWGAGSRLGREIGGVGGRVGKEDILESCGYC